MHHCQASLMNGIGKEPDHKPLKKAIGNKPLFLLSILIEYNSIILQKQHNVKIQPISPYAKT